MTLQVQKIHQLSLACLTDLVRESQDSDFRAMERLVDEWNSSVNQFNRAGEALFVAKWMNHSVGICGLNIDPYAATPTTGRIRRLYVLRAYRRQGIGRALIERVIAEAGLSFDRLHVRTDSEIADRFYLSLGFTPCFSNRYVTHCLSLKAIKATQ